MTFIVRLSKDDHGRITGIVERVATGEKERFYTNGAMQALPQLPCLSGKFQDRSAYAINDSGEVVGDAACRNGKWRGHGAKMGPYRRRSS